MKNDNEYRETAEQDARRFIELNDARPVSALDKARIRRIADGYTDE